MKEGLGRRRRASRSWAGARAGSRRCSSPPSIPISCTAVVALLSRCAISSTSRPRRTASSRAYTFRLVGPLPEASDTYRDRSPVSRAAEIRAPVLLLHGDADTSVPLAQSEAIADALRAAGVAGRAPRVRRRRPRLAAGGDDRRRLRARRRVPDPLGASRVERRRRARRSETASRARSAARIARCCSRTARAPTCTRRRSPSWPTRSPTRASRRCASTSRTGAPGGARPTARRCSSPRCARRRPSSPGAPSCRPTGSCSAVARWAAASLDGRGRRRRRSVPALGLALLGYPLHPPGKPDEAARRALPAADDAGAVRERHARRVRHAAELKRHAKKVKGPVTFSLGRDRRPQLQAVEGERADRGGGARRGRRRGRRVRRRVSDASTAVSRRSRRGRSLDPDPASRSATMAACVSIGGSRSSTSPGSRRSATSTATKSRCGCSRCSAARCARSRPTSACASPSGSATAACWCRSSRPSSSPRCASSSSSRASSSSRSSCTRAWPAAR